MYNGKLFSREKFSTLWKQQLVVTAFSPFPSQAASHLQCMPFHAAEAVFSILSAHQITIV